MRNTLEALLRPGGDPDSRFLAAPTVGRYLHAPPVGTYLAPGAEAGVLRILARQHRLLVPPDGGGTVAAVLVRGRAAPVERGQQLLALTRGALDLGAADEGHREVAEAGEDVPEGMLAIRSPTDGIFYRRPGPEDPPYVAEGDVVERGKVLGLVEVMKCFNQIRFSPPDGTPRARVSRIVPPDSGEVKLGQALFYLEPE